MNFTELMSKFPLILQGTAQEKIKDDLTLHWERLQLLDQNLNFKISFLKKNKSTFLPEAFHKDQLIKLSENIAKSAVNNPYLKKALNKIDHEQSLFPLFDHYSLDLKTIVPQIYTYAYLLSELTKLISHDPDALEELITFWNKSRGEIKMSKSIGVFELGKLYTIEHSIKKMIYSLKENKINNNFYRYLLPINILEAGLLDLSLKNISNFKVALTLAKERPITRMSKITKDKKAIEIHLPNNLQWNDLYSIWNLSFVTNFQEFYFGFIKLLIPEVLNYRSRPECYIYYRVVALYIHLHHAILGFKLYDDKGINRINWKNHKLTKIMGEISLEGAKDYKKLKKRKGQE